MSDTTTRGIRIQVRSTFVPDKSSPRERSFVFQYHVRITNVGSETAKLVSRQWIITNAEGEVEKVTGPGVVGDLKTFALQPAGTPGTPSTPNAWLLSDRLAKAWQAVVMGREGGGR